MSVGNLDESVKQAPEQRNSLPARHLGSLKSRILIAMISVAIVPLVIMAYQGYHCARQAIIKTAHTHMASVANSRLQRINAWLDERKQDMTLLRDLVLSSSENITSPEARRIVFAYHRSRPLYESVLFFAGKDSRQVRQEAPVHKISDEFWTRLETSRGVLFSASHFHSGKGLVLHIGLRVLTPEEETLGYFIAIVDLRAPLLATLSDSTGLGKTGKAYLLSTAGRYLIPPPGTEDLSNVLVHHDKAFSQLFPAAEYIDSHGTPVIGSHVRIPDLDWVVVCEMNQSEGFGWLHALRSRAIITGAAVLLGAVLIALWSADKLAQPFQVLSTVAKRVGEGHHEERVHVMETTEAQDVAMAFNRMLDRIEAQHRKVVQTASLAAIGELTSSVVHEMRNPLSSIKLNLSALQEKVKDDPDYVELASIACEQALRLERMLSDLLSHGRPLQIRTCAFPLVEFLEEAMELCKPNAEKHCVKLNIVHVNPKGVEMYADREYILQAITNLVLNAIQASPRGAAVTVRASALEDDAGGVKIAIVDSGPGVLENMRERIFEPFFTTRERGTGLGLANVKKIMEYHGGIVRVENNSQGGAVFTLNLPGAPT